MQKLLDKLIELDKYMQNIFQRISFYTERKFGVNCFDLTRFCITFFIFSLMHFFYYFFRYDPRVVVFLFTCLILGTYIIVLVSKIEIETKIKKISNFLKHKVECSKNRFYIYLILFFFKIEILIVFFVCFFDEKLLSLGLLTLLASLYFIFCDILPPSEKKKKDKFSFEALKRLRALISNSGRPAVQ